MNTPTKTRGVGAGKAADLTYWEGAARVIASVSKSSKIIVEKSTVPVKTADAIEKVRWLTNDITTLAVDGQAGWQVQAAGCVLLVLRACHAVLQVAGTLLLAAHPPFLRCLPSSPAGAAPQLQGPQRAV